MKTFKKFLTEHLRNEILYKLQAAKFDAEIELGTSKASALDKISDLTGSIGSPRGGKMPHIDRIHELASSWRNGKNRNMVDMVNKNPNFANEVRNALTTFAKISTQHPYFGNIDDLRYPMLPPSHSLYGMSRQEVIEHHVDDIQAIEDLRKELFPPGSKPIGDDMHIEMMYKNTKKAMSGIEHAKGTRTHPDEVDLSKMPPDPDHQYYG